MVRRRQGEHRLELRAPLGRAAARRGRGGRARRGRLATRADVRRALARGDAARRGARRARRRARATASRSSCRCRRRWRSPRTRARTSARSRCRSSPGFAAPAVAQRLQASRGEGRDHGARRRRGAAATMPMLEILEEARREAPRVEHVVVAPWDELVADSAGRAAAAPRSTRRRRTCSPTPRARPGRRRASSTSRAASSSRSRARSATRPTCGPDDVGSTSSPTWAGSWARGPSSAARAHGLDARLRRGRARLAAGPALAG